MPELNRRNFLRNAGAAAITVLSLPVLQERLFAADAAVADKPYDIGPLKSYDKDGVTDKWAKKSSGKFFVIRKDGKLYACSSICTHKGVLLVVKDDELYCKAHHSEFSFDGTVTHGPAKSSLERYAIAVDTNGVVSVDTSKSYSEKDWDTDGSYIKIPA